MGITRPTEVPAVKIGDREIRLQSFKSFKAAHVFSIVAEIGDEAKQIAIRQQDFVREYRNTHTVRVGEGVAALRGWEVPDGQWQVEESGERYIDLPQSPTDEIVFLEVFQDAWELAEIQIIRVLALLLVDNDALADAEDQSPEAVADLLDREGKRLMRESEVWELVDLADAARLMVVREMETRAAKTGKLRGLWSTIRSTGQPQPEPQEDETPTPSPTSVTPAATSDGSPTRPAPPTDGHGGKPSTVLATATSSTS